MAKLKRTFRAADGTVWRVAVKNVGASNAQVVFEHPDPRRTREHRYAHYNAPGPESQNVTGRLDPQQTLAALDDTSIAALFRRSMAIAGRPTIGGVAL